MTTCPDRSVFPRSAILEWNDESRVPVEIPGKRWKLELIQLQDTCGIDIYRLRTEIVIFAQRYPDPEIPVPEHVDVPVRIEIPGRLTGPIVGHQYSSSGLKREGEDLAPSYIHASNDYHPTARASWRECENPRHLSREIESVQFTGMKRNHAPKVEVAFYRNTYRVISEEARESCITGEGRLDPGCSVTALPHRCKVIYSGEAYLVTD